MKTIRLFTTLLLLACFGYLGHTAVSPTSTTGSTGATTVAPVPIQKPATGLRWMIALQGLFPTGGSSPQQGPYLGEIRLFAAGAPYMNTNAWAECAGQILPISQNSALFALLGTTFGGNGTTNFALPDLRGRTPIGAGQGPGLPNYVVGQTGGSNTVTVGVSNLPSHSHTITGGSTDATGAGAPVNNMPPYLALYPFLVHQGPFFDMGTIRWTAYASTAFVPGILCEGQILPIAQNTALFSILGTNYGGNGQTTYGIPDLRGRMMVGAGTGPGLNPVAVGEKAGQFQRAISVAEMPAHAHTYGGGTTGSTGSGSAVPGRAPYLGLTPGVALVGIYGGSTDFPAIAEVRFNAGSLGFFSFERNSTYWSCDGSLHTVVEQDGLFETYGNVVGPTWGGDGATTVGVPDLRGRSPFGAGTDPGLGTFVVGEKWGSDTIAGMTQAMMPAHTHTYIGAPPDTAGPTGGTFSISPASPVANGTVLTGSFSGWTDPSAPLTYSIHLGTTAIVAPASNTAPTFTLPPGTHSVIGRVTDSVGNSTDTVVSFTVLPPDTTAPTIGGTFSPLSIVAGTALPDYRGQAITSDNVGVVSVTQVPAPGTPTSAGTVGVALTARDAANNAASVSFIVTVTPANPVRSVLASKGSPVPGAGVSGSGIPADAVWQTFGSPSVNDAGEVAVYGTYKAEGKIVGGTFKGGAGGDQSPDIVAEGCAGSGNHQRHRERDEGPVAGAGWFAGVDCDAGECAGDDGCGDERGYCGGYS